MSERAAQQTTLTVQVRTQSTTGFEKNIASWGTDTTLGHSGAVVGALLDATGREVERALARGEVVTKVLHTQYPVGLQAARHRVQTSGGTNYRIIEVMESSRRGLYALSEDTAA